METTQMIPSPQQAGSWRARRDSWEEAVLTWHEQADIAPAGDVAKAPRTQGRQASLLSDPAADLSDPVAASI
jgi:hypothetical protein